MKKIITVMIALGATILALITSAPNTVKASGDYIGVDTENYTISFNSNEDSIGSDVYGLLKYLVRNDMIVSVSPSTIEIEGYDSTTFNDILLDSLYSNIYIQYRNSDELDVYVVVYPSGGVYNSDASVENIDITIQAKPFFIEKVEFEVINKPKHGGGSEKRFSPNPYPLIEKYGEFETIGQLILATNLIGLKYNSDRLNVNQESLHFNNVDSYQLYDADSTIEIDDIYSNGRFSASGNEINVGDTFELIFVNEQEIKSFEDYVDTENYTISFNSNEDSIGSDVYGLLKYLVRNDMIVSVSPSTIEIEGYDSTTYNFINIVYDEPDFYAISIVYTNSNSLDAVVNVYPTGAIGSDLFDAPVENIDITIQAKPFVLEKVEFEVIDIDVDAYLIIYSENTYNDIHSLTIVDYNDEVSNLITVKLNGNELLGLQLFYEGRPYLLVGDDDYYYFDMLSPDNMSVIADYEPTIGDNWELTFILPAYTITFETNGGSNVESILVGENQVIEEMPSNPTRSTYIFIGWYYDEELTQEFDINTPITEDMTLYAKWESNYRTISFVTNANRTKTPITILSGESLGYVPSAPTKRGYTFVGWYYDEELTQEFDINTPITEDMTLYAKWQLIDNDRIEFTHSATESWNGTVTPGTTEKLYGLLNKYGSLENGYMKLYWASLMIDGQVYLVNIEDTSHGLWIYYIYNFGNRPEYELYFWDDNMTYNEYGYHMIPYGDIVISYYPTHIVSFNTNGGTAINDMTVDRFDSFDQWLPTPSRSGYYFAGWYLDAELTKDFNEEDHIAEFTVERNIRSEER